MEIEITKETKEEIELKVKDRPTVFMLIKEELDKMPEVLIAAWKETHPLIKEVTFYVRTDGSRSAREVLMKAIENALKRVHEFEEKFKETLNLK